MSLKSMLTLDQVVTRLNVHHSTVRRFIHAGKLPASKIGKDWRIDPDDLEAFIAGTRPVVEERSSSIDADDQLSPASQRFL